MNSSEEAAQILAHASGLVLLLGDYEESEAQAAARGLVGRALFTGEAAESTVFLVSAKQVGWCALLEAQLAFRQRPPRVLVLGSDQETLAEGRSTLRVQAGLDDLFGLVLQAHGERPSLPIIALLAGGNQATSVDVLRVSRCGWPLILIGGSGGFCDGIFDARTAALVSNEPDVREIIEEGDLHFCSSEELASHFRNLLDALLVGDRSLRNAWLSFSLYDLNAMFHQRAFNRIQNAVILLGVLATLVALTQTSLFASHDQREGSWLYQVLHITVVVLPILTSVLFAASGEFKSGQKYISLRAGAEAVKREIYQYRTQTAEYRDVEGGHKSTPRQRLAARIKAIGEQVMSTGVNESALRPYTGSIPPVMYGAAARDDGLTILSPDAYVRIRLGDQLSYYQLKGNRLERQLTRLRWIIYASGGAGTLLASLGFDLWIPLTTSLVAGVTTYLEYQQTAETLMRYSQAANDLAHVVDWWYALPVEAQRECEQIDALVQRTEDILGRELADWVSRMRDAIAEIAEKDKERDQGLAPGSQ